LLISLDGVAFLAPIWIVGVSASGTSSPRWFRFWKRAVKRLRMCVCVLLIVLYNKCFVSHVAHMAVFISIFVVISQMPPYKTVAVMVMQRVMCLCFH